MQFRPWHIALKNIVCNVELYTLNGNWIVNVASKSFTKVKLTSPSFLPGVRKKFCWPPETGNKKPAHPPGLRTSCKVGYPFKISSFVAWDFSSWKKFLQLNISITLILIFSKLWFYTLNGGDRGTQVKNIKIKTQWSTKIGNPLCYFLKPQVPRYQNFPKSQVSPLGLSKCRY